MSSFFFIFFFFFFLDFWTHSVIIGLMDKPNKKTLIREIAEQSDLFDFASLARTNITNLIVIRDLLAKG